MSYTSKQKVLDLIREPFFWKLFNAHKEERYSDLWLLFNEYLKKFSNYDKSKWHSEILSIAERFMQEEEEWRFLEFFKEWNPEKFLEDDWKEVNKDGNTYKPLAIKCLKKAYAIIKKHNKRVNDCAWLFSAYETAVSKYPEDEWILREQAILFIKSGEFQNAIDIYKKLVLDLGDKAYIWHEFSLCFKMQDDLKIGMLAKAILLERNDDYLGDIRLELAETLIEKGSTENAASELIAYKEHRDKKGWKIPVLYNELWQKCNSDSESVINNSKIYERFVPIAEEFAYNEIEWTEVLLIDTWQSEKGKERFRFSDGKNIDFSVNKRRFNIIDSGKIGTVYKSKIYKKRKQIEDIGNNPFNLRPSQKVEYEDVPLLMQASDKENWSILPDEYAVVEYINTEKKVVHALTTLSEEVFFKGNIKDFKLNDFIVGKKFLSERKGEKRLDLFNIKKIDKSVCLEKFPNYIAIVDHVNNEKNLFHFTVDSIIHGIVKYPETPLRPNEGTFIEIWISKKIDRKRNRTIYKPIEIKETKKTSEDLLKTIYGIIVLKYKVEGRTYDLDNLDDESQELEPDFGFIDDYYVPRDLIKENGITYNCAVLAKAIFTGDKWKVIEIHPSPSL